MNFPLKVQIEYNTLRKRFEDGVDPFDINPKCVRVGKNKVLIKLPNTRCLVEKIGNKVFIYGIANKDNSRSVKIFARLMNETYGTRLRYKL